MNWFGKEIPLMRHPYNCSVRDTIYDDCRPSQLNKLHWRVRDWLARFLVSENHVTTSERTVEIPLALNFLQDEVKEEPVLELGCVLPYYIFKRENHLVYDLMDNHPQAIKKDIRNLSAEEFKTNIISISTLEHIGLSDYGIPTDDRTALATLQNILRYAKNYFVSIPLGANTILDKFVLSGDIPNVVFIARNTDDPMKWEITPREKLTSAQLQYGRYWCASSICVLTNKKKRPGIPGGGDFS